MGFYVQDDMWEAVAELPRKTQDEVAGALLRLFFAGEQTELKGVSRALFVAFRERVALSRKRAECGAQNGKRTEGKAQSKTQSKAASKRRSKAASEAEAKTEPSIKEGERDKEKDNPCGLSEKKARTRFSPPTRDEVAAFCAEGGLCVDAARFCDYYASKGWRVGSSPMRDWRAACRNWARRDGEGKGARDDELDLYAAAV